MIDFDKMLQEFVMDWCKQHHNEQDIENAAQTAYNAWLTTPAKELNGQSPKQFLQQKSDEEIWQMFICHKQLTSDPPSVICDEVVDRKQVAQKLRHTLKSREGCPQFWILCANLMQEASLDCSDILIDFLFDTSLKPLIRGFAAERLTFDVQNTAERVLARFADKQYDAQTKAYVADALYSYKHDTVYNLLIELFLQLQDVALYSAYLREQGDERAINVLKSVANEVSRVEYLEIRACVEALGGEVPEYTGANSKK